MVEMEASTGVILDCYKNGEVVKKHYLVYNFDRLKFKFIGPGNKVIDVKDFDEIEVHLDITSEFESDSDEEYSLTTGRRKFTHFLWNAESVSMPLMLYIKGYKDNKFVKVYQMDWEFYIFSNDSYETSQRFDVREFDQIKIINLRIDENSASSSSSSTSPSPSSEEEAD